MHTPITLIVQYTSLSLTLYTNSSMLYRIVTEAARYVPVSHPKLLIVFVVVRVLVAQTLQPTKLLALH